VESHFITESNLITEGIILRAYQHSDNNLVLKVLTPEFGKLAIYGRNIRNSKKRFFSIPEIFDKGNLEVRVKENSLHYLINFSPIKVFKELRSDFLKLSLGSVVVEAFDNLTLENQQLIENMEHQDYGPQNYEQRNKEHFEALELGLQAINQAISQVDMYRASYLSLCGLLNISGFLDSKQQPQASRNNLVKIFDSIETYSEKQLVSRSAVESMLVMLKHDDVIQR
jgi:Recombination protein O N terminal